MIFSVYVYLFFSNLHTKKYLDTYIAKKAKTSESAWSLVIPSLLDFQIF
jgi:hypothetical protein